MKNYSKIFDCKKIIVQGNGYHGKTACLDLTICIKKGTLKNAAFFRGEKENCVTQFVPVVIIPQNVVL